MYSAFTYLREWYEKKIQSGNIYDDPVGQQSKTWRNAVAAYAHSETYLSSINDFRERFSHVPTRVRLCTIGIEKYRILCCFFLSGRGLVSARQPRRWDVTNAIYSVLDRSRTRSIIITRRRLIERSPPSSTSVIDHLGPAGLRR